MTHLLHALLLLTLRLTLAPPPSHALTNTVAGERAEAEVAAPSRTALERYQARAFEEALPAAEEAVERAWKEYGGDDYHTIAAEEFLAHLAALTKDPGRAKAIREETDRKLARLGDLLLMEKIRVTRAEDYRESTQAEAKEE